MEGQQPILELQPCDDFSSRTTAQGYGQPCRMQRLLSGYNLRKGSLTLKLSNLNMQLLDSRTPSPPLPINHPGPTQEFLVLPLSSTQTTAALKNPCPRGAFQGPIGGKPVWHLGLRKECISRGLARHPTEHSRPWMYWYSPTEHVWVAILGLGFSKGHRTVATWF